MAYQMGKGAGFRPVGSANLRGGIWREGTLNSKGRVETTTKGTKFQMRESDFPSLVPTRPAIKGTRITLYTVSGIPFPFDPSIPPPQLLNKRPLLPTPTNIRPLLPQPTSTNIRPLLPASITRRLTTRRPASLTRDHQTIHPRTTAPRPNPPKDLHILTSTIFRFLQLSHHRRNWATLPASLNFRLNSLLSDIKPPLLNDDLRGALSNRTDAYRKEIAAEVVKHLDHQLLLTQEQLRSLKPDNLEEASRAAEMQLRTRLRRRFNKSSSLNDLRIVGSFFNNTSTNVSVPNISIPIVVPSPVACSSNQAQGLSIESSSM